MHVLFTWPSFQLVSMFEAGVPRRQFYWATGANPPIIYVCFLLKLNLLSLSPFWFDHFVPKHVFRFPYLLCPFETRTKYVSLAFTRIEIFLADMARSPFYTLPRLTIDSVGLKENGLVSILQNLRDLTPSHQLCLEDPLCVDDYYQNWGRQVWCSLLITISCFA